MKILLAVDGSPFTKRMLAYLAAHDEWLGGAHAYTLLHVAPAVPARAASMLDKAVVAAYYSDESAKVFKPLRSFFAKQKLSAEFIAKVGHAADHIAAVATQGKYDLLVMGSHGHGALGSLVMGSVTARVMAHCQTPLLIVR